MNVLVYAHRTEMPDHVGYKTWLDRLLSSGVAFGFSELVASAVLRLVTNPRVFDPPTPLSVAIDFVAAIRSAPGCVRITEGDGHWPRFIQLCQTTRARGGAISNVYLATLAIESNCEWITADRGFARYPGLRWRHPLDDAS